MWKLKKLAEAAAIALGVTAASVFCVFASMGEFSRSTLVFNMGEQQAELRLLPGETPDTAALETAGEGLRFVCWLDEDGLEAEPGAPAYADAEYTALLAPALAGDALEPWLGCDENGFARPEAPITGEEAAAGAEAVFSGDFEAEGLRGEAEVSASEFAAALEGAFRPGELDGISGDEPLTRLEAARLVCALAGKEAEQPKGRAKAPDLDPGAEGAAELLACLEPESFVRYADGLVNIDGWLYLVRDGLFVRSEEAEGLSFGADGRFTSGSAELDALVAGVLAPICEAGGSREELLRAAYVYVRDSFSYLRRNYYALGEDGWQVDEALTMFRTGRGNCYCYAAAFWALARGLGFDARAVSGTVGYARSPHGWVYMRGEDGGRVVYDVELEMAYRYERHIADADFYALSGYELNRWQYVYGGQDA